MATFDTQGAGLVQLGRRTKSNARPAPRPLVRGEARWALSVLPPHTMWRLDEVVQPGRAGQRVAPWMPAAVPLLRQILADAEIETRLVRFGDDPFEYPPELFELTRFHYWRGTTIESHLEDMERVAQKTPEFFEAMVEGMLAGGESVFGFSVYRLNAGVTLQVARELKRRRPECRIILGGPEAGESPEDLRMPWIDAVVSGMADRVVVALVSAALNDELQALDLPEVWLNPALADKPPVEHAAAYVALSSHEVPVMDYAEVLDLLEHERSPVVPVLLNVGCPFDCGFCTNRTVYPEFIRSPADRVVREIQGIVENWESRFHGEPETLRVMFCDATVNAEPAQFDAVARALCDAELPSWVEFDANVVVDGRVTPQRAALMQKAGFRNLFFGLESASHAVRRDMKKPGRMEAVVRGLESLKSHGSQMSLAAGLVIGWPTESDADFEESLSFVERMGEAGALRALAITLLAVFPGAQNPTLLDDNRGEHRGLLWERPVPAGSIQVRGRRFLEVYERLSTSSVHVISALEPAVIHRWMLEHEDEDEIEAWVQRFDPNALDKDEYEERDDAEERARPRAERDRGEEARAAEAPEPDEPDAPDEPDPGLAVAEQLRPLVNSVSFELQGVMATETGWLLALERSGESLQLRIEPQRPDAPAYRSVRGISYSYQNWKREALSLQDFDQLIGALVSGLPGLEAPIFG